MRVIKSSYLNLLKEAATPQVKIPVKHPGVLEVPEGKEVDQLGEEHFKVCKKNLRSGLKQKERNKI